MKLSIRSKLFLAILPVLIILEGLVIGIYARDRQESFLRSNERRFELLAQSLIYAFEQNADIQEYDQETLKTSQDLLITLTERFYENYTDQDVAHIAIIDRDETFLAHSDRTRMNAKVNNQQLSLQLGGQGTQRLFIDGRHHVLTPIVNADDKYMGTVDVGFSQAILDTQMTQWWNKALKIALGFLILLSITVVLAVHVIITKPLKYLGTIGERILEGDVIHTIKLANRNDEVASLAQRFIQISGYLRDMTDIAQDVATGKLEHNIKKKSKRDTLSIAMQEMLTYLQSVAMFASKIAGGDLTNEVPLRSDVDAFGRAMRAMRMGLQTLIQQIRDSAEQLASISTSVASLSNRDMDIVSTGHTTVEQLVSIITQMGMSAEEIASNMDVLSASVEQTSASVTEMATSISSIASSADELQQQTDVTINALVKATETLEEVAQQADESRTLSEATIQDALEGQDAVEQVTVSMDIIQQTNSNAVETITRFAKQTEDIDTILDVIDEITDQSSLLALNASIIAAQAGSHGRGFAVIADEMRSLATKVSASTKDIAAIVQTVQKETATVVQEIHKGTADIEQGVTRTQQARQMLEKITDSAQRSSNVVATIVKSLEAMQETTGQDMKVAMERVHTMTASITRATNEQKSTTLQINDAIEHIRDMAVQTRHSTTQQLEGVQQVLGAANDMRKLTEQNVQSSHHIEVASGDLNTQAHLLLNSVDQFKLLSHEALAERQKTGAVRQVETAQLVEDDDQS